MKLIQRALLIWMLYTPSICLAEENKLELLISPEEISHKIADIAKIIDNDYRNEEITLVMIMKGAVCTTADLMRHIKTPATLEYLKASSYGHNGNKQGDLKLVGIENLNLKGKNVLVIDDIFDTGNTMTAIVNELKKKEPKTLRSLVAFEKKIERKTTYRPNYILFQIDNHFIVGYGLDYKEKYRGLPGIYKVTP